jgi:hypothetical protein
MTTLSVEKGNSTDYKNAFNVTSSSQQNSQNRPHAQTKVVLPADIDFSGWLIPTKELTMEREIGRGAFGVVYKGQWRGIPVAVKQILSAEMNEKDVRSFVAEIALMRSLRPHGK